MTHLPLSRNWDTQEQPDMRTHQKNIPRLGSLWKTIPISMKRKAFNQCILMVLTYGAERPTLTKTSAKKLKITQRRMETSMLGLTLRNRVQN